MAPVTLDAVGLAAHAAHLGLVLFGLIGVALLLAPSWRASRAGGVRASWRPPTTAAEHDERVASLRATVDAGTLTAPPAAAELTTELRPPRADGRPWRAFAVLSCVAAGIVHLAVFPHHIEEAGVLVGGFFVVAAAWQGWWAWRLTQRVTAGQLWAGIAGSLGLIALWAWSRTLGLPFGLTDGPEELGGWDLACEFWQVCVVLACLRGLSLQHARHAGRLQTGDNDCVRLGAMGTAAWAWAGTCAVALVVLSVTASIE